MRLSGARKKAFQPGVKLKLIIQRDAVGRPPFVGNDRQPYGRPAHGPPTQPAVGRLHIVYVPVEIDAAFHRSPGGVKDTAGIHVKQRVLKHGAFACRQQIG